MTDSYTIQLTGAEIDRLLQLLQVAANDRSGEQIKLLLDKISKLDIKGNDNIKYNNTNDTISLQWIEL